MQRLVDIEIDQEFQLHTSYHNDFFLLRTKVLVDGRSTEIRTVQEGSYEGPVLTVCHSGSTSCKLWLIANAVSPILHRFGVYHVDTFYYEPSPLFHIVFSSESCLRKFLLAIGEVKSSLEKQLHSLLSRNVKSTQCHVPEADSQQELTIKVQPELFLVSPSQLNTKGADLHVVTADNCSTLLTHWKSSKLFEFASLYQEEAQPPHITLHPASQNDVLPGGSLTHLIRATGAEPLGYQWQWKPAEKEDEQHEWQDLSCDGTTFQEVEGGLKITGVQECHAGDYRCVVSNSAGSEISLCANLTVAKAPKITTQPMDQKDILQGSPLSFKIKATGAEPLSYQWQWKPAGKEDEQHEWQDLSRDGTTFQEVEGELKITGAQACHAGKYRCVVSNSAGSEISWCATLTVNVVPELLDLVRELRSVNNWKTFGLYLGIKIEKLIAIEMEHPIATIEEHRTMMLEEWQNNVIPTWSAVVQALVGMGMQRLASNLAQKHGIPTPEEPDDEPVLEQLKNIPQQSEENAAKLREGIQKLRDDLKQDRKRLVDSEELLRQLQESKQAANENAKDCLTELEKLREDVQKIVQEKSNIEMELKVKEHECQLLSEIKEDKAYNVQFLQNKIAKKKKKINRLKQELQSKECKLLSAQQEAQQEAHTCQEELSQARAEVRKKHEEVKELRRENEKLASSYNIKKEEISNLVQIAVTFVKKEIEQHIVSMKEESELNLQRMETSYSANIRHLSEEIEALTSSLQKKEAAAEHLQVASTPEQLLESLTLMMQIAELERRLQESEYQKQHAESKREAAVREVKATKDFEVQLHAQLGDQLTSSLEAATPTLPLLTLPTPLTPPTSTDSANHPEDAQAQQFSLKEEIRQFEEKYADLTVTVQNAFITGGVSVRMILRSLQVLPASLKQQCGEFLQFQAARLSQASIINELFFILSPHWDFLNPGLLAHLAHKFGDEQAIKSLKEYLAELREFQMRTKIGNFTGASVHSINIQPPGRCQQLRSDHEQVPQSMSLQDRDWTAAVVSSPIGSAGGSIHWEEYGIDIEIPPGAITSDICQQFVLTCHVPEKVKFQKSYIPIGPLFTIRPSCKFKKNISISFQHWADADCIKSTSMQPRVLRASDLETFSAGKFTELPNVSYDEERITATCNHFCVFCTAMKMKILRRGARTCSYKYTAVLHLPQRCIPGETWTAVFSISRKSKVFAEALKQILEEKCKHEYCYQYSPTIHFSQSSVATLNIPMDDAETQGYSVEPCRPYTQMGLEANQISKKEVDNPFSDFHGVNPPQIQLFISPWDPNAIPTKPLDCKLRLEGITGTTTINFKVPPSSFQAPSSPTTEGVCATSPVHSSCTGIGRVIAPVPSKGEGSSCHAVPKGKFSAAGEECTWEDRADTNTSMPGSSPAEEVTPPTKRQKKETATEDTPVQLSSRPTLPELLNFHGRKRKINIIQEIGIKYTNFGILLLKDETGSNVAAITKKHLGSAELINIEILQEWLAGRGKEPVSWRTLIEVLRKAGLGVLADDIEAVC